MAIEDGWMALALESEMVSREERKLGVWVLLVSNHSTASTKDRCRCRRVVPNF